MSKTTKIITIAILIIALLAGLSVGLFFFMKNDGNLTALKTPQNVRIDAAGNFDSNRALTLNDTQVRLTYVENGVSKTTDIKITVTAGGGTQIKYFVYFDAGGGYFSGNPFHPIWDEEVIAGNTVKAPNNPAKDGYNFDGWHTKSADGILSSTAFNFSTIINSNITLYAKRR